MVVLESGELKIQLSAESALKYFDSCEKFDNDDSCEKFENGDS